MLQQKEKRLLHQLLENKGRFVTSKHLAQELACSDRTVRTYLKSLKALSPAQTGWELVSKQGYGYKLVIVNQKDCQNFIKSENILEREPTAGANIEDRYSYLLNKLLFEQAELYFDDLAEELFVSRSTLSADFRKIRRDLAPYQLKIESKAKQGVYIQGKERDKRRFIMDYFFRDRFFQSLHHYINIQVEGREISLEELTIIVLDECREGQLRLSDFVIQNLVVHIALSFKRLAEGFQISQIEGWSQEDYELERRIARRILERVRLATGLDFPEEEVDYITLHLISKASCQLAPNQAGDLEEELRRQLIQVLENSSKLKPYGFAKNFQLIEGLVTHLSTFFLRLKNQVVLDNPLLKEIKDQYLASFELTREVLEAMPLFAEESLSDDEVAYVALHFMAALEHLKEEQKFRVLVICATGYGSAQMLKNRIEHELGNLVEIVDLIGYYELNDQRLENIDFIISSIDLSNLVFTMPVFTVSIFLNSEEVKMIKQEIAQLQPLDAYEFKQQVAQAEELEELFQAYFSEDYFVISQATSKAELLEDLLIRMSAGEEPYFVSSMQDLIEQREKLSSVVFSPSLAVPHPIKPLAKEHKIGLAILPEGLYWNQDFPNIRLVFLLSPAIYDNQGLSSLTGKIVQLLERPDLEQGLLQCSDFSSFKQVFLSIN
ncbi:BglG family transcription antiterminator [Streptococcus oricebi]|uniref:Transcription antiterminator BglG n=1 Tax=Streptococcus oricebi TaxID=1547447 RepID=A0ABS5B200_9STRE|nr:transcription antiterminator BglG [Streptococcus oricebi]